MLKGILMAWEAAPVEQVFQNLHNDDFQNDHFCFVCGRENPIGLHLSFEINREEQKCRARFTPQKVHQGWTDVVHGGILATLFDEVMVNLTWFLGSGAVTAELTTRLKESAKVGEELVFTSWIERERGPVIFTAAEAVKTDGAVVASASAKLMKV